jgi:hypothetical protein
VLIYWLVLADKCENSAALSDDAAAHCLIFWKWHMLYNKTVNGHPPRHFPSPSPTMQAPAGANEILKTGNSQQGLEPRPLNH